MKIIKRIIQGLLVMVSVVLLTSPLYGGEGLMIRRIRKVPNRFPELIPGDEVLEVDFVIRRAEWLEGVGWSLHLYDQKKKLMEVITTAYFPRSETPARRIKDHRLKGNSNFTAFFPLSGDPAYLVLLMGTGEEIKAALLPSSELVEEFNISREEVRAEFSDSEYRLLDEK